MRPTARFLLVFVSCVAISGLLGAAPPRMDDPGSTGPVGQGTPGVLAPTSNLWFVELSSPPLSEGLSSSATASQLTAYRSDLHKERQDFRNAAAQAGVKFKERFSYENLWNGLSVEVKPAHLLRLSRVAGVVNVWPVAIVEAPEPAVAIPIDGSAPELFTAIGMIGADQAHAAGYTGAGIKVAVMDTGIDYNHPDFGGGFGPGYRIVGGYDFVGDAYSGFPSTPQPDSDPMDCNGHGTHVAGILGANGGVVGVAPEVTFNAYRVFGCAGTTTTDIMLAAMERVLADGNQILNMSIGSSYEWPNYPTARGADNLVNSGVVVVCSAGNAGARGPYSMSAPGVGQKSIASASVDNTQLHLPAIRIGPGYLVGYVPMTGASTPPTSGVFEIVNVDRACNADLPLPSGLTGRIALFLRRRNCTLREQAINAFNAGAASVLFFNDRGTWPLFGTVGTPALSRPVVGISLEDGIWLQSWLPTTGEWTTLFAHREVPTGGFVSSFSSYGVSPDLTLKPDIAAPGGVIFSTLPLAQGGYGVNSGTSMASPHVAGAAALLLQAQPNTPSQVVRDILQNSATNLFEFPVGCSTLCVLVGAGTWRQGAGLVKIPAALGTTTRVTPGKLSLGETEGGPVARTLTMENKGASTAIYNLSSGPGVSFSANPVAVAPGSRADVDITFTEPAGLPGRSLYGGSIVIRPQGGGQGAQVPYVGLKGDYQSVLVLNPSGSDFGNPLLRPMNSDGASGPVTITNTKPAYFLVHLDHQVRRLRLEAFSTGGPALGRLAEFNYVGRNAFSNEFFSLTWDGADPRRSGFLPNGTYHVRLSIQKALGDSANPAHWETWTSPVITIDRNGGGEPQP